MELEKTGKQVLEAGVRRVKGSKERVDGRSRWVATSEQKIQITVTADQ